MAWQNCVAVKLLVPDSLRRTLQGASTSSPQKRDSITQILYISEQHESVFCVKQTQEARLDVPEPVTDIHVNNVVYIVNI